MAVTWICLIVCATCRETSAEIFFLLVPENPISASLGSSVVLSCLGSPPFDPDDVRWYRPGHADSPLILYENPKIKDSADPQYRGRVFFTEGLKKGDVSLRLENLTLADRGQYVCYVHRAGWYDEANISLTVRVTGSIPVMSFSVTEIGEHVNVTCVSDGWTPEPTLTWRDKNNNEIKQNSNQVHFYDDAGFVEVSSWLLYSSSESEWLSCSVSLSNQERREGRIMPTKITTTQCGHMTVPFIISLILLLMLIIGIFMLYRKGLIAVASKTTSPPEEMAACEDAGEMPECTDAEESLLPKDLENEAVEKGTNTEEKEKTDKYMNTEGVTIQAPEWESLQPFQVKSITLNPTTAHVHLTMSETKGKYRRANCSHPQEAPQPEDKFPHVLSCESFKSGQHCWGVMLWADHMEFKSKESWFVGVCSDPAVQTQRFPLTPQNAFWGLQYESETGLFANTNPATPVPMSKQFRKLGLFLDCDKHTLSFYNVDTHSHLCTFESVFPNRLFAVISPGVRDRQMMEICADVEFDL